jgi:hypothetical protein
MWMFHSVPPIRLHVVIGTLFISSAGDGVGCENKLQFNSLGVT